MEEMKSLTVPTNNKVEQEVDKTMGDGVKVCPLCQSEVRLFFINFNEKMLMCENYKCEYPFGYEDLEFVREDMEFHPDEEIMSIKSKRSSSPTCTSMISTTAWSEINRINKAYETDDGFDMRSLDLKDFSKSEAKQIDKANRNEKLLKFKTEKDKILKDVADIKEMNYKIKAIDSSDDINVIKNGKWIKTLMGLQGMSGCQLLKEQELENMKREQPNIGLGELKIDIDTSSNGGSCITIEISNNSSTSTLDTI